jgi:phage shock protein PspC (stress-responsive transcriptional regulator)
MLGGVCSGMAAHFGIDVTIMRVIWIVLILTAGAGLLIYIALYFVLPETDEPIKADRKLFRDTENAWINGVCSGIAHYFKISPNIPRLVFAIPVITIVISSLGFWNHGNFHLVGFSFNGGLILAYVILSYVIPPARTDFDRMDMNGQAVNLESIKNNIKDQMGRAKTDIKNQAQKMGSSSNFGKEFGGKVTSVGSLIANILGSFISIVVFLVLLSVSLVLLVNYNKIDLSLHWIQASNWEKKHAYWGPGHFVSVGNFGTCAYIYERG